MFEVHVEVAKWSRENLASIGANPVHLSYHWRDEKWCNDLLRGPAHEIVRAVHPSDRHRQRMVVAAPAGNGHLTLRVTLVQELVAWFTELPTAVYSDVPIVVRRSHDCWTVADVTALCGVAFVRDAAVSTLGFVSAPFDGMLSFALTDTFVDAAVRRGCHTLIVPPTLVPRVPEHIGVIESDEPTVLFSEIHEALAKGTDFYGVDGESRVHPGARVHPTAIVDAHNVRIADGVVVGAGCVISGRVTLGQRVEVGPGSVIGAAGFQTIRTSDRLARDDARRRRPYR